MSNTYHEQAEKFLKDFGLSFSAVNMGTSLPPWDTKHVYRYTVTLSKSSGASISFDFYGSINDRKNGQMSIHAYDVLACASGDINCPANFRDFCSEYGYEDTPENRKLFKRCDEFGKKLRGFFRGEKIRAALAEIA